MKNKGTIEMEKLLKDFKNMTKEEYEKLYSETMHKDFLKIVISESEIDELLEDVMEKDVSVIPEGVYCYSGKYTCPYWGQNERGVVYCQYLDLYDYSDFYYDEYEMTDIEYKHASGDGKQNTSIILWDSCKECGINEDMGED